MKRKLQTVYKNLKNVRNFLLHSISKCLIDDNDIIPVVKYVQDANIRSLK